MPADPIRWPVSASKARKLPWSWEKPATACRQVRASKCGTMRNHHRGHTLCSLFFVSRLETVLVGRRQHVIVVIDQGPPRLDLYAFQRNLLLDRGIPRKSRAPQEDHVAFRRFQVNRHGHTEIIVDPGLGKLEAEDDVTVRSVIQRIIELIGGQ